MPGCHLLVRFLLLPLLMVAATCTQAADPTYFKFSELMASPLGQRLQDPTVRLYWATQAPPAFAEVAPPEVYARRGPTGNLSGQTSYCLGAFEEALGAIISDARRRGYDAVINLQAAVEGVPSNDREGFQCVGDGRMKVALWSQFAMTPAAFQRMVEADERSTRMPARQAVTMGMFVPLEPILTSPEARQILGPDIHVFWGIAAPKYGQRYGPDTYSESATNRGGLSDEATCGKAVLESLKTMVKDAEERGLNAIIKLRSYIDERYAPVLTDVECRQRPMLYGRLAVSLQASLASIADERIGFAPLPARLASKDAVFLPLGPILASPEARSILGSDVRAILEFKVPKFRLFKKPEVYSESVSVGALTQEEACKQAVLRVLGEMATDARKGKFDAIIRIRSYLGEKYAPVPTDFECKVAKKEASVELRAVLAKQ